MRKIDASEAAQAAIWFDVLNKSAWYAMEGFSYSAQTVEKVYWMGQSATFAFYIFVIKIAADCEDMVQKKKVSFLMKNWLGFALGDFIDECAGNLIPTYIEFTAFFLFMVWVSYKFNWADR